MNQGDAMLKLLTQIRDRLPDATVANGTLPRLPTQYDGVELPLVLATITSNPVDVRKFGPNLTEVWKHDVHHYPRGLVLVQVDSIKPPAAIFFGAEIEVTGFISGVPDVLVTTTVNTASGPLVTAIVRPYDRIRVAARQMVNGIPDQTTDSPQLIVTVTSRFER